MAPPEETEPPLPQLPRWIPVLIGAILVTMAGLAVLTGIRDREPPFSGGIKTRQGHAARPVPPPGQTVAGAAHLRVRRGIVLNVSPDDAMVYVNGVPIGQVRQFNTIGEAYRFPRPGGYTVRIVAPNGVERTLAIIATGDAKQEVVRVSAAL